MKHLLALVLAIAPACDSHRVRTDPVTDVSFADKKAVRMLGLHTESSMLASQPDMIAAFAEQLALEPATREAVGTRIEVFAHAVTAADEAIRQLEAATAATWARRDEDVVVAMRHLEISRDAAWSALRAARTPRSS